MALDLPLTDFAAQLQFSLQRYLIDNPRPEWTGLAGELGLMSVGLPEAAGGSGGGAIERAVVVAELGPALAGGDWLAHHLGASLLAQIAPDHRLLSGLASGSSRVALLLGSAGQTTFTRVTGAEAADWLLVVTPDAVTLVAAAATGVSRRLRLMLDGTTTADVELAEVAEAALASGTAAREAQGWAVAAQNLGRCVEIVGLTARMLTDTADYLQQRKQFGVAIAGFQVLRHRMADMAMAQMKAAALVERAVLAEGGPHAAWERAVSGACAETIDAARIVGEGAVQCHGAMGLTEELALGGRFKRALALAATLGPRSAHLARYAELSA